MAFYAPPENVENRKLGPSLQAPPIPFACPPGAAFKTKKTAPAKSRPAQEPVVQIRQKEQTWQEKQCCSETPLVSEAVFTINMNKGVSRLSKGTEFSKSHTQQIQQLQEQTRARRMMGRWKRRELPLFPLPIVPRAPSFFLSPHPAYDTKRPLCRQERISFSRW